MEKENKTIFFNVFLKKTKNYPSTKKSKKAIKEIKEIVSKHFKIEEKFIKLTHELNEKVWEKGISKPPIRISLNILKTDDGAIEISLQH